ncbi:hypothetical protein [Mucilaginibacter lappiensis]|uniref:Uncharacterized protein n=1 Tax=Mucilaginibacter lappiensis TaxID=354630 RepID=A0A1N6VC39_9SPHI|nr:hypothetical protein [Mucilaginibacter lappiensis]MBB6109093.1 hypothetical protein [Mucilaginibacter lappiensis]MBB6127315.1 hypothetical protein [Mucilaginibacter lappiensis]SIQ75327.1 hypothetical protein SAMN05421821_103329 [Mucilaginibacter lappiensis]
MKQRKYLERRTFNQDRFDILIKRQKSGKATFSELTELDAIVNRDPTIRESILEEMQGGNDLPDEPTQEDILLITPVKTQTLLDKIASFFRRLFTHTCDPNPALMV